MSAQEIAQLNDRFRQTTPTAVMTPGVERLPDLPGLLQAVRDFATFTPDNDPHGEHDFGALAWHQERIFWKIDYYDQEMQYWEDPLSPQCRRLLTIMLASEY